MALFSPDLALTLLPGSSAVPLADRPMLLTCKSSMHTIAWFWLMVVVALCRKSFRQWAMRVTVDWSERESVRAKLRLMVKRILRKYKYPPDLQEEAVDLVLQQAQVFGESWDVT